MGTAGADKNTKMCPSCGRPIPAAAPKCEFCGESFVARGPVKPTWKPMVGGLLTIVGAIIAFAWGGLLIAEVYSWQDIPEIGDELDELAFENWICAIMSFIFGAIALFGGVMGMQRKNFQLAETGAICSIAGGIVIGLIATILISISKDEFKK